MSLSSLLVWRFFCRTVIDAQRPSGETWTSSARRVASSSSGVKGRRARRSASSSVAMGVRSLPRARSSGGAHLPGCQTPVRGCLSRGRLSRLEEVKAAQMCAAGTGGRHEAQVGRADCGALVACACVGGEWLAVQPAVRGELSHPVRRLPAEQEVAAGVEGGERAELRRLMQRLADGDRGAFSPAFALLWPRLRAFAVRYVGAADGEDAAQAALLRVFSRAGEYDADRDALAWALGIAAWECRTLRRQRSGVARSPFHRRSAQMCARRRRKWRSSVTSQPPPRRCWGAFDRWIWRRSWRWPAGRGQCRARRFASAWRGRSRGSGSPGGRDMAANESAVALEVRARRAYELGRLRAALRVAPFVLAGAAAAVAVAALTGALGCTIAGVAGVLGMLAGTVAAGAPVLVAARR